jgi:hypothetical protein
MGTNGGDCFDVSPISLDDSFVDASCYKRILIDLLNDAYQEAAHQGQNTRVL